MQVLNWVSKDGRETPIEKMADTHLVNTIRRIEREADEISHDPRVVTAPEDHHPLYGALRAELLRRPQQAQDWYIERRKAGK